MAGGKGVELATAYLTLIPSLKGATRSINDQLSGIDASKSGVTIGKTLSDGLSKGVSADSVKVLERAVTSAEDSVSDALYRSEQATRQVEVAQKRLAEARKKYGDDSSQAAQAELNLMNAQHRSESAGRALEQAQAKLSDAQDELAAASKKASDGISDQVGIIDRLKSSASAAGPSVEKLGDKLSNAGDALTSHFTVPLAAAAAGAGAFAISTASAAETSEMAFTTMLGSAEAARDMLDELASFAAHTPFELSGLTTATQQLLAYGFTAEDIIPMLTAVGDATAALGTGQQGIEAVTRALGQMQTRGKVTAEEMLQLTEAGIPAWEYLAEAIGTDTAGAMEAVSDGAVSASEGIQAIVSGMENDFGGMMEKQSTTVAGLMSNLADAIEQPLMALRDSDAYERFADTLSDLVDAAGPFVESLLPHMEKGIDKVSGVLDVAADAMDGFTNMSEESQSELIGIVGQVALLGPAMKALGPVISTVGKAMKETSGFTSLLQGGVAGLAVAAASMVAINIVGWFLDAAEHERLLNDATMDFDEIMSQAADTASASGDAIAQSFFDAGDAADDVLKSMSDLNEQAVETLSEISVQSSQLDTYLGIIDELAGKSKLTASEQEKLKQAVKGYNDITGDSVEVTDAASGKLSESTDKLHENADAWIENANAQAYQSLAQQYLEEKLDAQQKLKQAQDELADSQERLANADIWNTGISGLIELKNKVSENQQAVDDLSNAAKSAGDNYEAFSSQAAISMSGLSDNIKSALSSLPGDMQMAGLDIASSLSSGIEAGTVSAEDAMRFLNDSVAGTVASLPPTMRDAGMQAAQSLADAVASGEISVEQAAAVLSAAVSGDISSLPAELAPYGEAAAQALGSSMSLNSALAGSGAGDLSAAAAAALQSMPSDFGGMGASSSQSLSDALVAGVPSTGASAASLADAANAGVAPLPSDMSGTGAAASSGFASGIGSGEGATRASAGRLSSAASTMGSGNSWQWGNHLGGNFAAGIRAASGLVSGAASLIASTAKSILGFSTPDDGPWSGSEKGGYTSGLHLGENFAAGMMAAVPGVRSASDALAEAARPDSYRPAATAPRPGGAGASQVTNVYIDGARLAASSEAEDLVRRLVGATVGTAAMGRA